MSPSNHNAVGKRARARAFTVVELLVAVSLMTLIVLALYSMFNQTQKAMLSNENQVDSTERGRGVLELVSREIETARVGLRNDATNLWIRARAKTELVQNDATVGNPASALPYRTNVFDDVFYLTKFEKSWRGVGYAIMQPAMVDNKEVLGPAENGMGNLYRYETTTGREFAHPTYTLSSNFMKLIPPPTSPTNMWPAGTNFNQIASGVVHFKLVPYDTKGEVMAFGNLSLDSNYRLLRKGFLGLMRYPMSNIDYADTNLLASANVVLEQVSIVDLMNTAATFRSNALPAYVELELGVLEPDAMRIYNQMLKDEQTAQARAYLARKIAKVQIFRKRIPFRTVAQ